MNSCPSPNIFTIFTGDKKTMNLRIAYATGLPVDLSACTEISVSLPNADGSFRHLTLGGAKVTITSPAILGQFAAIVDEIASALLNIGEGQNVDVTFTISAIPFTVRFWGALSVFERD